MQRHLSSMVKNKGRRASFKMAEMRGKRTRFVTFPVSYMHAEASPSMSTGVPAMHGLCAAWALGIHSLIPLICLSYRGMATVMVMV